MEIKLYHKDIYLPQRLIDESINLQKTTNHFELSQHCYDNMNCPNRSHQITETLLWNSIKFMKENPQIPFEVETTEGKVSKYVVRIPYISQDVILVIRKNKVITYYLNSHNDTHTTLNKSKYEKEIINP